MACIALVAAAAGGWWARDTGIIPGNPRAPSRTAFEAAIREFIAHQQFDRFSGAGLSACVGPDLAHPAPEAVEGNGLQPQPMLPGAYALVLARTGAPLRERQIAQLRFLAQQGFFAEEQGSLPGGGPALRFKPTWEGWRLAEQGRPCIRFGDRELVRVEDSRRTDRSPLGLEAWYVTYRVAVRNPAPWASTDGARLLFPSLERELGGSLQGIDLLRGEDGWLTAAQAQRLGSGRRESEVREPSRRARVASPGTLDESQARRAILGAAKANPRIELPCLALPEPWTGDYRDRPEGVFSARLHAPAQGASHPAPEQWRRLEMFAAAGILNRAAESKIVTYTVKDEFKAYMASVQSTRPNCLRVAAGVEIDRLSLERVPGAHAYRFAAHAALRDPLAWTQRKPYSELPEVAHLLEYGLSMRGVIDFPSIGDEPPQPRAHVSLAGIVADLRGLPPRAD